MSCSSRCTCFSRIGRLAVVLLAVAAINGCSSSDDDGSGGMGSGGTPADVVLTITGTDTIIDYLWDPVTDVVGPGPDATLTLTVGTRYEVNNTEAGLHPFELTTFQSPGTDIPLASQFQDGPVVPWESDPEVNWVEVNNNVVRFTVTAALALELSGYRCFAHQVEMRGMVNYTP